MVQGDERISVSIGHHKRMMQRMQRDFRLDVAAALGEDNVGFQIPVGRQDAMNLGELRSGFLLLRVGDAGVSFRVVYLHSYLRLLPRRSIRRADGACASKGYSNLRDTWQRSGGLRGCRRRAAYR